MVAEDSDNEIGCVGYGLPTPTVTWSRGGTGNLLQLKSVTKADQGNYTCIISNLAGTTTATVKIIVTSKILIIVIVIAHNILVIYIII